MQEINSLDISKIFAGNNNYGGTYARDEIPEDLDRRHKFYMINLDSKSGPGTHWTCCFNCRPDTVYYFDSFGAPPPEMLLSEMKQTGKEIHFNGIQIQNLSSIMCGYYCIDVLRQLNAGKSFKNILSGYSNDTKTNEKMINEYAVKQRIQGGGSVLTNKIYCCVKAK